MINIEKHVLYWRNSAEEDFEAATQLIRSNKIRHGLFFLHLALEKILKAHVCQNTGDLAPRLHNLVRLAEISGIDIGHEHIDLLSEFNPFNLEGRYPEMWTPVPSRNEADNLVQKAENLLRWLINLL